MKKILFSILCSLMLVCSITAVNTVQRTAEANQHSVTLGQHKEVSNTLISYNGNVK